MKGKRSGFREFRVVCRDERITGDDTLCLLVDLARGQSHKSRLLLVHDASR